MPKCSGCLLQLGAASYSSAQLKKKGQRRCAECVAAGVKPLARRGAGDALKSLESAFDDLSLNTVTSLVNSALRDQRVGAEHKVLFCCSNIPLDRTRPCLDLSSSRVVYTPLYRTLACSLRMRLLRWFRDSQCFSPASMPLLLPGGAVRNFDTLVARVNTGLVAAGPCSGEQSQGQAAQLAVGEEGNQGGDSDSDSALDANSEEAEATTSTSTATATAALYAAFIPLRLAYKTVAHWHLWKCLSFFGVPDSMATLLQDLYTDSEYRLVDLDGSTVRVPDQPGDSGDEGDKQGAAATKQKDGSSNNSKPGSSSSSSNSSSSSSGGGGISTGERGLHPYCPLTPLLGLMCLEPLLLSLSESEPQKGHPPPPRGARPQAVVLPAGLVLTSPRLDGLDWGVAWVQRLFAHSEMQVRYEHCFALFPPSRKPARLVYDSKRHSAQLMFRGNPVPMARGRDEFLRHVASRGLDGSPWWGDAGQVSVEPVPLTMAQVRAKQREWQQAEHVQRARGRIDSSAHAREEEEEVVEPLSRAELEELGLD